MEFVNELANVKPANVIPDFVTSVDEASLYVAEGVARNFADLDKRINLAETRYFQRTGRSIVYEGVNLKAIKNAIIEKLKKLWAMVKKAFEFVMNKIKDLAGTIAGKIQGKDKVLKRLKEADPSTVLGKAHEFARLDNLVSGSGSYMNAIKAETNRANTFFTQLAGTDMINRSEYSVSKDMEDAKKSNLKDILIGKDAKEATQKLIDLAAGKEKEVTVAETIKKLDAWYKLGTDYKTNVKKAKSLYDAEKKAIEDLQSKINAAKDINVKLFTPYIGKISTAITVVANAAVRSLHMQNREIASILARAAMVKKSKESKEAKNESYVNSDLDVLFDF